MSQEDKNPKPADQKDKTQEVHVVVDNTETKRLAEELAKAQQEKKAMEEKITKIEADKKAQDEASKALAEETESLKNQLGIIAEKELEKKRSSVTDKAKTLLKDDVRVKEITDKLSTPEGIAAMEYTMNVLEKQMKVGEDQFKAYQEAERKKVEDAAKAKADADAVAAKVAAEAAAKGEKIPEKKPEPAGSPLNAQQMGNPQPTDLMHMKFDSYQAMVRYLQETEKGPDKLRAAEAKVALEDLLKKWASLVKKNYNDMRDAPMETFDKDTQPSIKEMGLSKRAKEEIERRRRGEAPQSVAQ